MTFFEWLLRPLLRWAAKVREKAYEDMLRGLSEAELQQVKEWQDTREKVFLKYKHGDLKWRDTLGLRYCDMLSPIEQKRFSTLNDVELIFRNERLRLQRMEIDGYCRTGQETSANAQV